MFSTSANDAGRKSEYRTLRQQEGWRRKAMTLQTADPILSVLCVRTSYGLRSRFKLSVMWHGWLLCSQLFLPANLKGEGNNNNKKKPNKTKLQPQTTVTNSCLSQQQSAMRPTACASSTSWSLQDPITPEVQRGSWQTQQKGHNLVYCSWQFTTSCSKFSHSHTLLLFLDTRVNSAYNFHFL